MLGSWVCSDGRRKHEGCQRMKAVKISCQGWQQRDLSLLCGASWLRGMESSNLGGSQAKMWQEQRACVQVYHCKSGNFSKKLQRPWFNYWNKREIVSGFTLAFVNQVFQKP